MRCSMCGAALVADTYWTKQLHRPCFWCFCTGFTNWVQFRTVDRYEAGSPLTWITERIGFCWLRPFKPDHWPRRVW